tara:strand:- start:100 stop:528 length:429 start_codon:yes stop_codon:yes gene_type:complete
MTSVTDYYNIIRFNKNENLQKLPNEIIRNIFEYVKHDFMIKVNKHYLCSRVIEFIKETRYEPQRHKFYRFNYVTGENSEYVRTIFKFNLCDIPYKVMNSQEIEKFVSMYFAVNNYACKYSHHFKLPSYGVAFLISKLITKKY